MDAWQPRTFRRFILLLMFLSSSHANATDDSGTKPCLLAAKRTCYSIKAANSSAPSGIYAIITKDGNSVQVYCEMGLDGGGYTFLHPFSLSKLTSADVAEMFTDKMSFLLRVRSTNGSQPYAVLSQLLKFSGIPLKLGLTEYDGYVAPVNINIIPGPFLYYGFVSREIPSVNDILGLSVNGVQLTYTYCSNSPSSQFTLFPNFQEVTPTTYISKLNLCFDIFNNALPNPSGRVMPADMFMFGELHFGGCGCYIQSNQLPNILSFAIGFR